jgi:hypothetical protein
VIVAVGSQGNLQTVTCAPEFASSVAEAGARYYVLAFDDQSDGGGNGGTLDIAFRQSTLPDVDFSVDAYGQVDARGGIATITGSYTCTAGASITIFADASQRVGRFTILGSGAFSGEGNKRTIVGCLSML